MKGSQAGVALKCGCGRSGWLSAQAWAARFPGGTVSLAGRRSGIDRGELLYGGRLSRA